MSSRLSLREKMVIVENYRHMKIKDVAVIAGKKHKTVNNWLNQRGFYKRPNYTNEDEQVILNGGTIKGKSKNAIKIKKWRLKNAQRKLNS
jgi:transposase